MSGTGWAITLSILYLVLIFTLALLSFRKGHWVLGLIGFVFPVLWLIGAILPARPLKGTPREIVVLNAGVALYAANVAGSIADGIDRARAAVASGAAQKKLEQFVATTRKLAGSAP